MVNIAEIRNMFWGVTLDGGKRYSQTVEHSFHISMAALEPVQEAGSKNTLCSVMIQHNKAEFLLCTLQQGSVYQFALDLNFMEGEEVTFFLNGKGVVHLTGYLVDDDMPEEGELQDSFGSDGEELSEGDLSEEEEAEGVEDSDDSEDQEIPILQLLDSGSDSESEDEEEVTGGKRKKKQEILKNKKQKVVINEEEDDEDSEEDPDFIDDEAEEASEDESDEEIDEDSMFENVEFGSDDEEEEEEEVEEEAAKSPEKKKISPEKKKKQKTPDAKAAKKEATPEVKQKPKELMETPKSDKKKKQKGNKSLAETPKTPATPETPESAQNGTESEKKKKKKKKKKNKGEETPGAGGDASAKLNQSQSGTPQQKAETPQPKSQQNTPKQKTPKADTPKKTPASSKKVLAGGMVSEDLKLGHGPEAKSGKMAHMYYAGRLQKNNKMFDANLKGKPFKFKLGKGEVIKGWDIGVQGMKVGGKRKLTIPASLAYGSRGAPPDIPPHSTLVFDVELKSVS